MLKRAAVLGVVLVVLATIGYVLSPFRAAWVLREAIASGDKATVAQKVEWESVRASLKASLMKNAALLPEINAAGEQIQPTLWQRVKAMFGATMVDRFVESYVTPEGLPKLFTYRQTLVKTMTGKTPEPPANADAFEKLKAFYARVRRAEFKSLTSIEFEIADGGDPNRRYVSLMRLDGTEWKLSQLSIVIAPAAPKGPAAAGDAKVAENPAPVAR